MDFDGVEFETLVQLPESQRDSGWEQHFLKQLVEQDVLVLDEPPRTGPDGWPYLQARTGSGVGQEPFVKVLRWLAGRGIGLVLNPHKMVPDYVFTYGMLWSYAESGWFFKPLKSQPGQVVLGSGEKPIIGVPTEAFLPPYVRSVIREFLRAQGFESPKILAMTDPTFEQADLLFSLKSLNGLAEEDHAVLAEALSWFLPPHYGIVMAIEEGLPEFAVL